jgi:hypothetical protein
MNMPSELLKSLEGKRADLGVFPVRAEAAQ